MEKRTKAFERMLDLRESYVTLSKKLSDKGIEVSPKEIYRYITGKEKASKQTKLALAKILGCLVSDIF